MENKLEIIHNENANREGIFCEVILKSHKSDEKNFKS